jgi:anti-anti-sigma regulatory factor
MSLAMQAAFALPQELTIYVVAELHPTWMAWLAASPSDDPSGTLVVDASQVAEADAAGVQLLIALANALARHDRQLLLVQPSATLTSVCQRVGASFLLATADTLETTA